MIVFYHHCTLDCIWGPAYPDLVTDTIKSKFKSCIKREQNNLSEDK